MTPSHALMITGSRDFHNEALMRETFNEVWRHWGSNKVTSPLLISGNAPRGADALAEKLWAEAGFDLMLMPANWSQHGRAAGPKRNTAMVQELLRLERAGVIVAAAAFLAPCTKQGCSQPGPHFSHGTMHARNEASKAGVIIFDAEQRH